MTTPAGLFGPAATPKELGAGGPEVSLPVMAVPESETLPASSVALAVTVIPSSGFGVSDRPVASTGMRIVLESAVSVSPPLATFP